MKDSSIVISMYNTRPETVEVIDKLLMPSLLNNSDSSKQLILLDDASPLRTETQIMLDKNKPDLASNFGDFKYIKNSKNLGFAKSYNKGIKISEGESIIIGNDDIYFPINSIDSLLNKLNNYPNAGLVGPVTNYAYSFQNTNLFEKLKDYSAEELQRIENFSAWLKNVMEKKDYESKRLIGFCLAAKKDLLKELDYFDERYKYGTCEDSDLNMKVLITGKKIILDASTFVEHGGSSGGSISIKQHKFKLIKSIFVNTLKYSVKWSDYSGFINMITKSKNSDYNKITGEIISEAERKNISLNYNSINLK